MIHIFFTIFGLSFSPVDVEKLLALISQEQSRIHTLRSRFTQVKESQMFLSPQKSQGVLYYKAPDLVRWEFHPPKPLVILIKKDMLELYYPDKKILEKSRIRHIRERVFKYLSATEPLSRLKTHFMVRVRDNPHKPVYIFELEPITFRIKKYIKNLILHVDRKLFIPTYIEYTEKDGDKTSITFSDVRINQGLSEDLFVIPITEDITIREFRLHR